MFEGRGHGRDAEFQFLACTGNREDRLGLKQPMNAQGRAGGFANGLNAFLIRGDEFNQDFGGLPDLIGGC